MITASKLILRGQLSVILICPEPGLSIEKLKGQQCVFLIETAFHFNFGFDDRFEPGTTGLEACTLPLCCAMENGDNLPQGEVKDLRYFIT